MKKLSLALALILVLGILASCGANSLVGTWEGSGASYTFNSDGTGTMTVAGIDVPMTWKASGNKITFTTGGVNEENTYKISGDTLTIESSALGMSMSLTKVK